VVRNAPRAVTRQGFMPDCGRPVHGVPKGVTVPAVGATHRRSSRGHLLVTLLAWRPNAHQDRGARVGGSASNRGIWPAHFTRYV
jgi:hypothetical protein